MSDKDIQKATRHVTQNERLIFELSSPGKAAYQLPPLDVPVADPAEALGAQNVRAELDGFPEVSEIEVVRHFTRLSTWNYGVDTGAYPLGSCTMKYNPKINEVVARLEGLGNAHPCRPDSLAQGCLRILRDLSNALIEITGMDAVTLQPAAGAHGEMTGLLLVSALHQSRGRLRHKVLIPDSAHGTNPASATLAGYDTVSVPSNPQGMVDLAQLDRLMDEEVGALMLTNPNTLGVFEREIVEIGRIVHSRGGLIYMDGANMNALVGVSRPGDFGVDVLHLNLHKTFSTPHGGGGPGAGPVAVKRILEPFLPTPLVRENTDGSLALDFDRPQTIGRVRAFVGNFGVLVRALAYILANGAEGLRQSTEDAVLNSVYLRKRLEGAYELPYRAPTLHECVFSDKKQARHGVRTGDIAKRLMDYGFHPYTVSFPLIVPGALMTANSTKSFAEQILQNTVGDTELITVDVAFAGEPPTFEAPRVQPEDICFLQYTSGSTTLPRGVMVTHANLMANMKAFMGQRGMNPGPDDVGVSWLPLYHDMGLIGFILGPLVYIGPVIILATTSFARDPRIWLKAIDKYRGTITYAPNFAYAQVVKRLRDSDLEALDLSCLRIAGCGAEPIHAPTLRSFAERLAPAGFRAEAFLPSYGLAESTLAISLHQPEAPIRTELINAEDLKRGKANPATDTDGNVREIVSCGFPLPDHQLAIVNEEGAILSEREVGEIVFIGPSVTKGYFQNPEATRGTWRDGWLYTGDLGYLADGELFVCGRSKELIIIRGANYYPHDIEWTVRDLPGIKRGNVAAFSVNDLGEERLVIVAESDTREIEALRQAIRVRILEAVGLEVFRVVLAPVGTLLRTTSGKLQRRKMKQLFEQGEIIEL